MKLNSPKFVYLAPGMVSLNGYLMGTSWVLVRGQELVPEKVVREIPVSNYIEFFGFQLKHVKEKTVNFITQTSEPRVPFWSRRVPGIVCSGAVVVLMVVLVITAVFGVILYRMSMVVALSLVNQVQAPPPYCVPYCAKKEPRLGEKPG